MARGSMPGERRGGRKLNTPNRRTILTDRILSIGLDLPTASRRAVLAGLAQDQKLPADTRIAVASKCFPAGRAQSFGRGRPRASAGIGATIAQEAAAKTHSAGTSKGLHAPASVPAMRDGNPKLLGALLGIVQDATADPKAQRRAALKIAELLLPKAARKAKAIPDEYGFSVNPNLASAYRDIQMELQPLLNKPERTRKIPAIAEKIKRLQASSDAIHKRLQAPSPTRYDVDAEARDFFGLMQFNWLRYIRIVLSKAQQAEEAHRRIRYDLFARSAAGIQRRNVRQKEILD